MEVKIEKNSIGLESAQSDILQNIDQLNSQSQKIDQVTQEIINLKNNEISQLRLIVKESRDKVEEQQSDLDNKQVQINLLNQKISDMQSIITNQKEKLDKNNQEIQLANRSIKTLKENDLASLEVKIEKLEQNISVLQVQVLVIDQKLDKTDFEAFQNSILKQLKALKNGVLDQEVLDQLSSIIELTKRVKQLEKTTGDHTQEIAEIQEQLKQLRTSFSQKADLSDIEQLQGMINQLGQSDQSVQGPIIQQGMSLQEKTLLKELQVRVQQIENTYMTSTKIDQTYAKISDLDKFLLKAELDKYAKKIDLLKYVLKTDLDKQHTKHDIEQQFNQEDLQKYVLSEDLLVYAKNSQLEELKKDLEEQIANQQPQSVEGKGKGNVDNNTLQKIKNAIQQLDALLKKFVKIEQKIEQLEKHASEMEAQYVFILQELEQIKDKLKILSKGPRGSDIDAKKLQELEEKLNEKINQLTKECEKKYADKLETRRALKHIDKLIKSLWDQVLEQKEGDKDAMLSKKPLMGFSCASCEKQLEQVQGVREKFHPWNLLPRRVPPLSKIGKGFSKLIQSMSPDPNQTVMFLKKDTKELFEVSSLGINFVGKSTNLTARPLSPQDTS